MPETKYVAFRIKQTDYNEIQKLAEHNEVGVSTVIRWAVSEYLEKLKSVDIGK